MLALSFDLTYEGLKFVWCDNTTHAATCFDLTYEGLKYSVIFVLFKPSCVLILPMRDWN